MTTRAASNEEIDQEIMENKFRKGDIVLMTNPSTNRQNLFGKHGVVSEYDHKDGMLKVTGFKIRKESTIFVSEWEVLNITLLGPVETN